MDRILPLLYVSLCLSGGVSVGWWLGQHRPLLKEQERLLDAYRLVEDTFGVSDKTLAAVGARLPDVTQQFGRSDEIAAAVALSVLRNLEGGRVEKAEKVLAQTVSMYFHSHRSDGDTNFLAQIAAYASTNVALSNIVYSGSP